MYNKLKQFLNDYMFEINLSLVLIIAAILFFNIGQTC